MSDEKGGRRMTLSDWLAANAIPDSNTLNKAYLRSLSRKKRDPQLACDPGKTRIFLLP